MEVVDFIKKFGISNGISAYSIFRKISEDPDLGLNLVKTMRASAATMNEDIEKRDRYLESANILEAGIKEYLKED